MATLDEIRAKLLASENKQPQQNNTKDPLMFPHWEIKEGESTVLRFLPDADPSNTYFWRERQQIVLTFNGVLDGDSSEVSVRVPCMEAWKETCPIISETRAWWSDPSLEDLARKYWKKRTYFMQGFVIDSPLSEEEYPSPENPIRKFLISPQIFNIIKASVLDPEELSELPTDYECGLNFTINKTTKGKWSDYTTSKFSRRETSLNDEQRQAIENFGLFDLNDWMPAKPTPEAVSVIADMFQASVNGDPYDLARWGNFYRPYGLPAPVTNATTVTVSEPQATVAPQPQVTETAPSPQKEEEVSSGGDVGTSAADILAKIRARSAAE
jgi:hypothetical protein